MPEKGGFKGAKWLAQSVVAEYFYQISGGNISSLTTTAGTLLVFEPDLGIFSL
jgi:hypothetical protein